MTAEPDFVTRTKEALADPKPGDRFHEMYTWWTVVVAVSDWGVTVLQAVGPFNLVLGQVRNDETREERRGRIARKEPYKEWRLVRPWQERAEQRHFPSLADFQKHINGDLLADRGLDISAWSQQRCAP